MKSFKEQYRQLICDEIYGTNTNYNELLKEEEIEIIDKCFFLYREKIEEIKILNDEVKRLSIENLNLKSYNDNSNY